MLVIWKNDVIIWRLIIYVRISELNLEKEMNLQEKVFVEKKLCIVTINFEVFAR